MNRANENVNARGSVTPSQSDDKRQQRVDGSRQSAPSTASVQPRDPDNNRSSLQNAECLYRD